MCQEAEILAGTLQQLLQNCRALGHLQCRSLYIAMELEGERESERERHRQTGRDMRDEVWGLWGCGSRHRETMNEKSYACTENELETYVRLAQ